LQISRRRHEWALQVGPDIGDTSPSTVVQRVALTTTNRLVPTRLCTQGEPNHSVYVSAHALIQMSVSVPGGSPHRDWSYSYHPRTQLRRLVAFKHPSATGGILHIPPFPPASDPRNGSRRTTGTRDGWRRLVRPIRGRSFARMLNHLPGRSLISKVWIAI